MSKPAVAALRATTIATAALAGVFAVSLSFPAVALEVPEGPLVTTEWLEKNLNDPKLRVFEISVNPGQYERGHIPGSGNLTWHTDLNDTVRRDIVDQDRFGQLLSKAGVDQDSVIVLYGDNHNWFAAWGAWLFDIYDVKNVKLLDGGRRKWEQENRALANKAVERVPTDYKVTNVNSELRARLGNVLAVAEGKSQAKLIDIRSPDEFNGKIFAPQGVQELSIRAGHVPGAVNVPWGKAVNEKDGTFKSKEELKEIYAAVGIDGSKPVITYCRIGERSSHTWFALTKILGYEAANYDGSWTEYGNSVGVPVANPAGTVWGVK